VRTAILAAVLGAAAALCPAQDTLFGPPHLIATDASVGAQKALAVDIDGDGDLDLLSPDHPNRIVIHLNDGTIDPQFTSIQRPLDNSFVFDVEAADFDGDGDMDLATASVDGTTAAWLEQRNDAPLEFILHPLEDTPIANARDVLVADFDKDGDPDIIVSYLGEIPFTEGDSSELILYENTFSGSGEAIFIRQVIDQEFGGSRHLVAADFDLDGNLDIAGPSYTGQPRFWENLEERPISFRRHSPMESATPGAFYVAAGDLNQGGAPELLVSHPLEDELAFFLNPKDIPGVENPFTELDWAKILVAPPAFDGSTSQPAQSVIADFDRNGFHDIATVSSEHGGVTIHKFQSVSSPFAATEYVTPNLQQTRALIAADLDNDGDLDLVRFGMQGQLDWIPNTLFDPIDDPPGIPEGWVFENPEPFADATASTPDGKLAITTTDNTNTFAFWESPLFDPAPETGLDGPIHLEAMFHVSSEVADVAGAPALRLRTSSDSFNQSFVSVVNSMDDGLISPDEDGRIYTQSAYYLALEDVFGRQQYQMRLDFDLLNFDPEDAIGSTLELGEVDVRNFSETIMEQRRLDASLFFFEEGAIGFEFAAPNGPFADPAGSITDVGLTITPISDSGMSFPDQFGFWGTPPDSPIVTLESDRLYRVLFMVTSSAPAGQEMELPAFRLRLNDDSLRAAWYVNVESLPGGLLPTEGNFVPYFVFFRVPPELDGAGLLASFDMILTNDSGNSPDHSISLRFLQVHSYPMPRK